MATLAELVALAGDEYDLLRAKIGQAMLNHAYTVEQEGAETINHAARLALAKEVYANPQAYRSRFINAVIAANSGASAAQITGASDNAIANGVSAAWDTFIEAA